jgi:RecB family exonuclease
LFLAKGLNPAELGQPPVPLWRREEDLPDRAAIREAQAAFAREATDVPVWASSRPLLQTSHSALGTFRDCPYRFLLEKGWALAETEDVLELFRPLDHGRRAHVAMQAFLAPEGPGVAKLLAGDRTGALALLQDAAREAFATGAGSEAQRRLWETSFLAIAPTILETEIERQREWRLAAVELRYELPLGAVRDWLLREEAAAEGGAEPVALPALSPEQEAIVLRGAIDRVDLHRGGDGRTAVIDYKTGLVPNLKAVREAEKPQLLLYAVAVEAGGAPSLGPGPLRVVQAGYYRLGHEEPGLSRWQFDVERREGRAPLIAGARAILEAALAASDRARPHGLVPAWRAEERADAPPCARCPYRGACRIDERADVPPSLASRLAEARRR